MAWWSLVKERRAAEKAEHARAIERAEKRFAETGKYGFVAKGHAEGSGTNDWCRDCCGGICDGCVNGSHWNHY